MCQKCVDGVHRYFPGISEEDMCVLLWECTAFPCSDAAYTIEQLRQAAKRRDAAGWPDDWLNRERAYVLAEMDRQMAERGAA